MYHSKLTLVASFVALGLVSNSQAQAASSSYVDKITECLSEELKTTDYFKIKSPIQRIETKQKSQIRVVIQQKKGDAEFNLAIHVFDSRLAATAVLNRGLRSASLKPQAFVPSKWPLGEQVRSLGPDVLLTFLAQNNNLVFECRSAYSGYFHEGKVKFRNETLAADYRQMEDLTRRILGRMAAIDSISIAPMMINNKSVLARKSLSGEVLLSMGQWAAARGFDLQQQKWNQLYYFKLGNKEVIIPMAANKIRVEGKWLEGKEISALYRGCWYVPKSLVDKLK